MTKVKKSNFPSQIRSKFQILSYTSVLYLKRKMRTCTMMIQPEKVGFLEKKEIFFDFLIFQPMLEDPLKILTFNFPKFPKQNSKNGLLWDMSGIERNKVKNFGEPCPCPSETAEEFMVVRCFLPPPPLSISYSS